MTRHCTAPIRLVGCSSTSFLPSACCAGKGLASHRYAPGGCMSCWTSSRRGSICRVLVFLLMALPLAPRVARLCVLVPVLVGWEYGGLFLPLHPSVEGTPLRVMTANLLITNHESAVSRPRCSPSDPTSWSCRS